MLKPSVCAAGWAATPCEWGSAKSDATESDGLLSSSHSACLEQESQTKSSGVIRKLSPALLRSAHPLIAARD